MPPENQVSSLRMDEYSKLGEQVFQRMPAFNVLQERWFRALAKVYQNDLLELSTASAKDPTNEDYKRRMTYCAAQLEVVEFMHLQISNNVKK